MGALPLALYAWVAGQPGTAPPLLPGPPPAVGHEINGYVLVERVASFPRTMALTGSQHELEPEEALALQVGAITRVLHTLPGGDAANDTAVVQSDERLQLPEPHAYALLLAGGDASSALPALPQPFEEELLDEAHTYRLYRRVQRGAHGEVWRAVRSDDPCARPL